ncbi:MAG: hypothetical protein ACRC1K_06735, partial [Planctomycetia bacterium]
MGRRAMARKNKRANGATHRHVPGTAPGTLLAIPNSRAPTMHVIAYSAEGVVFDRPVKKVDELRPLRDRDDLVLWLNVEGLGDVETIMA